MRHVSYALNIPGADGQAGTSQDIRDLREATVAIHGGGTFSFIVQVKVSAKPAPTVVPAGNLGNVAAPTTTKPAADVPPAGDVNNDWIDLKTLTANGLVAIADAVSGAPFAVTHVRIFRTTGDGAQKAVVAGRDSRTK